MFLLSGLSATVGLGSNGRGRRLLVWEIGLIPIRFGFVNGRLGLVSPHSPLRVGDWTPGLSCGPTAGDQMCVQWTPYFPPDPYY
ncbi:hypothetical protein GDO86_004134 [Hymenochirus boettgeri]|uniref:Uncharacterized protein n=1 Tax=Hymenochirus boettgeri TaxID=247094 RepID=A0A8T2K6P1_9PIPI|nr:hypothetical protein GDO86_004134 [Hymenochirus boettgeri]